MGGPKPFAFISYRREDSRDLANLLAEHLRGTFGQDSIFMDVDSIRTGDMWPQRIEQALQRATVVVPMIGQKWLFVQDSTGRRRLDAPNDWVRTEVEYALREDKHLFPILVSGATMPAASALPESIHPLVERQCTYLTAKDDIKRVVDELSSRYGFVRIKAELDYPTPVDHSQPLPDEELERKLQELSAWRRIERPLERATEGTSIELVRVFKFRSFEDVVHFMATAARFISQTDHHPHWENQYKDLRASLSTWDTGHRVSYKDTRLAEYLDRLYREYELQ